MYKCKNVIFEEISKDLTSNTFINDIYRKFININQDDNKNQQKDLYEVKKTDINKQLNQSSELEKVPQGINDELVEKKLLKLIEEEIFEPGVCTRVEEFLLRQLKDNNSKAKELLNTVMLKNLGDEQVVVGLLHSISHIDYELIYPTGQTMAIAATRHENIEVQEYAVRCFENWRAIESIDILEKLKFEEDWLESYVKSVIQDLKEGE